MKHAFEFAFNQNFQNVVIVGTDLLDINSKLIDHAFELLQFNDVVLGPATDGGYYLLGLNRMIDSIFENKPWGTSEVFQKTFEEIHSKNIALLEYKNDIDYAEDADPYPELLKLINP